MEPTHYIYKYKITSINSGKIEMPKGAKILTCQLQGRDMCLWAIVEAAAETEIRQFDVYGTGFPIEPTGHTYISTVQDGGFVWHVFEINKP